MNAITQNGITYFPGANGTWIGTDGKKYDSRGPKTSRQFMEIGGGSAYVAPDAGDANDGPGGFSMRGQSPAPNGNGVEASGTDLSPKPVNIPGFVRNPFAELNLEGMSAEENMIQDPDKGQINANGQRVANIGGKMYEIDEEAQADAVNDDPNMAVNPDLAPILDKPNADLPFDDDDDMFARDYGNYEEMAGASGNDLARRAAILDHEGPLTPMAMREARGDAMGVRAEVDENKKMTGNYLLKMNDDDTEGTVMSAEQHNDYLHRGNEFLKDVMSGKITLGANNEYTATHPVEDIDATDFTSTIPVDYGAAPSGLETAQMFAATPGENVFQNSTYMTTDETRALMDPQYPKIEDESIFNDFDMNSLYN